MGRDTCEWDPGREAPATHFGPCYNEAVWSVGANGEWHLCHSCAALPRFKRFRKRTGIGANSPLIRSLNVALGPDWMNPE